MVGHPERVGTGEPGHPVARFGDCHRAEPAVHSLFADAEFHCDPLSSHVDDPRIVGTGPVAGDCYVRDAGAGADWGAPGDASLAVIGVLSAAALEFCLSNTVDTLQGVLLDVEVLADHFRSDACVTQSQRQGVRQRQFAQRLLACAKFVGHLTSVRP